MSTDFNAFLNYMATWDSESDNNINQVLKEHTEFTSLGSYSADSAIDQEFNTLIGLSNLVVASAVAADVVQVAADAATIASIWSFGLGMLVSAGLEAEVFIDKALTAANTTNLNTKLATVDTDIAALISPAVTWYITDYKANNSLIESKSPEGLDTTTCRAILMQFIAQVEKRIAPTTITPSIFRQYVNSARLILNSDEINKIYTALDELNLSGQTDADIQKFIGFLSGLNSKFNPEVLSIIKDFLVGYMYLKLRIPAATINANNQGGGLQPEEVEASRFSQLNAVGEVITCVSVAMSVVDIVLSIYDIVDVVEQSEQMRDALSGPIKQSYTQFYNGIQTAAQTYNSAMSGATTS